MKPLAFSPMGKKTKFIHIRADDALNEALDKAAERDVRSRADEARYLIMKSLGMIAEEIPPYGQTAPKGGGEKKKTG
jgi:hypothetical protein